MKYETANCVICKREFKRLANRSRPRLYCDSEKCQKIKRIKNTVARFEDLPEPHISEYRADIDYQGRWME